MHVIGVEIQSVNNSQMILMSNQTTVANVNQNLKNFEKYLNQKEPPLPLRLSGFFKTPDLIYTLFSDKDQIKYCHIEMVV